MPQDSGEERPAAMRDLLLAAVGKYVALRLNAFRTLAGRLDSVDELGNCILTVREGNALRPCVVRGQAIMDMAVVPPQQSAARREEQNASGLPQPSGKTA